MKSLRTLTAGERRRITDGDSDAFFDPPTPLGVVRRDGACPTRPWLLESDYLDQRRHATLEDALRELADDLGR